MTEEPEVLIRVEKNVGRITLNRPKALHALTLGMCETMIGALGKIEAQKKLRDRRRANVRLTL